METQKHIETLANELIKKIGVQCDVTVVKGEESYLVQITSESDAPMLIGKYGETLQSFQKVLEAMLYTKVGERVHVAVNVNDYREKQKERLEKIAENVAERVHSEGKEQSLASFSAYERKILHEYIAQNHSDLTSYSQGEGIDRKLYVAPKTS